MKYLLAFCLLFSTLAYSECGCEAKSTKPLHLIVGHKYKPRDRSDVCFVVIIKDMTNTYLGEGKYKYVGIIVFKDYHWEVDTYTSYGHLFPSELELSGLDLVEDLGKSDL